MLPAKKRRLLVLKPSRIAVRVWSGSAGKTRPCAPLPSGGVPSSDMGCTLGGLAGGCNRVLCEPAMAASYVDELAVARRAADDAGRFALGHFKTGLAVEAKADGSPVTIADRGAEERLRKTLAAAFPADGILGEELGETSGASGRRWIIDPIDGTQSFIRGVPLWGVLVALEDRGECVVGVVALPALGETLWAVRGGGAFMNGAPARVAATPLTDATILTSDASPRHFGDKHAGF